MYWNHKRRSKVKVVNVHPKLLVPVVDVSCFIQSNRVKSTEENQKMPGLPTKDTRTIFDPLWLFWVRFSDHKIIDTFYGETIELELSYRVITRWI